GVEVLVKVRVMGIAALICAAVAARPEVATAQDGELDALATQLSGAMDYACTNEEIQAKVLADPQVLLDLSGLVLPKGVDILTFPLKDRPFAPSGPAIELTHCRTFWACDRDDSATSEEGPAPCIPSEHEVCFGFRLVDGR
ncbi:MAG: hypothetical protein ABMA64_43540, partial [Myxococcota bacterium]